MLILAGNDVGPRTNLLLLFVTLLILVSAIINASIFGSIAILFQQWNRKTAKFQEKIENATSTMKNFRIDERLKKRIISYLGYTHDTLDQQNELDDFLKMLSPSLQFEVRRVLLIETLSKNPLFSDNMEVLDNLIQVLTIHVYRPEDIIIRQGGEADRLYFVAVGE